MYRKYYLLEVILLLLLSHGGWNGPSVTLLPCTSESSKLIRNVIQKQLLPVVSRYGVSLPFECPLHPKRDMFWWLQTDAEAMDIYKCPICGQKFSCENNFVTHWDSSHARNLGLTGETVCLDDYCDVLRCDVLRQKELSSRMKLKKASEDSSTNLQPVGEQVKKECHPQDMTSLRHKCRLIIRQCTIGLISSLSSKNFQDLEDELDQAICSYLTCEKYWDDFTTQIHFVPTIVCIIIALLIFTGFCLCYYSTWLLLESSKNASNPSLCCKCRKPRPLSRQKKDRILQYVSKPGQVRENGQILQ